MGFNPVLQQGTPESRLRYVKVAHLIEIIRKLSDITTAYFPEEYILMPTFGDFTPEALHKGDAIRVFFNKIMDFMDPSVLSDYFRPDDIVLYIDGEGINPKYLLDLARVLTEDNVDAVFGVRMSKNWGISPERALIELFELYITSKALGFEYLLPDGQCGIWGIKGSALMNMRDNLVAHRYEIELDLLTELLMRGFKIKYVKIEIDSQDTPERNLLKEWRKWRILHRIKLGFLATKFRLSSGALSELFKDFCRIIKEKYEKISKWVQLPENELLNEVLNRYKTDVLEEVCRNINQIEGIAKTFLKITNETRNLIYYHDKKDLPILPERLRGLIANLEEFINIGRTIRIVD